MKLDLQNKIAVVSGSTSGIGLGIAKGLASAGATVVVVGRKQAGVDEAIAHIRQSVPEASLRGVDADLTTEQGAAALFAAEPKADILVNNLGIFNDEDFFSGHCCKVSDEAAFCLIQRPYISKTLLTRRISPRG
ncbi:SDR family NAD(P)-dependent oxidoreductase, partial [Acinetobacter baumannii]|uniref:SDR family NAD(P)-dependent oxidoreductase n=1 Tax=Acinetobacter baumannii TaxID=470 RepID=UPI002952B25E